MSQTTIRTRDAGWRALIAHHPDETFMCAETAADRSALIAAGDALAEAVEAAMPGLHDDHDWSLLNAALDHWREVVT